jgi:hypothetical protein
MFGIDEPKTFFDKFVRQAYQEYLLDPLNPLRVKTAVHQLNVVAERMFASYQDKEPAKILGAATPADYRRRLVAKECADFQLVWDVDDGHKHVRLDRGDRKVSGAAQTGVRRRGGALGSMALGEAPLGGTTDAYVVVLDDGQERELCEVLANVMKMWERVVSKL